MEITKRKISATKLKRVAEIFGGLAHPVRLEILEYLEDGIPRTVGDILAQVKIDPTLLTHHLSKMKSIGILESERDGRNIYYRLVLKEVTDVFDCIQHCRI